jgi:hypothetical protein
MGFHIEKASKSHLQIVHYFQAYRSNSNQWWSEVDISNRCKLETMDHLGLLAVRRHIACAEEYNIVGQIANSRAGSPSAKLDDQADMGWWCW